jgi:hypothetical protein
VFGRNNDQATFHGISLSGWLGTPAVPCPEIFRTREALAVRRDQGVVLGRPRSTPDDVVARVLRERTEGKTAYAIARDLNHPVRQRAKPFI